MIPHTPLQTESHWAEPKVFDQLRAAFSRPNQTGWFAMHSLNLPRHEYKRWGEIDFVVCGPDGIFVIEVKGGGVSCRNGVWETSNKHGTYSLNESPFWQAEKAVRGLPINFKPFLMNLFGATGLSCQISKGCRER